jgi:hypothetical protein
VTYRVRIEYRQGDSPKVHVLSPELRLAPGATKLPHIYPGDRLCLFFPGKGEWDEEMSLAHAVIPWISEWLFFYEIWFATGQWLGGGHEPEEESSDQQCPSPEASGGESANGEQA